MIQAQSDNHESARRRRPPSRRRCRRGPGLATLMLLVDVLIGTLPSSVSSQQCVCVGDCNANGEVTVVEIQTAVTIVQGLLPLSNCPNLDRDLDGKAYVDSIVASVANFGWGCPPPTTPVTTGLTINTKVLNTSTVPSGTVTVTGVLQIPILTMCNDQAPIGIATSYTATVSGCTAGHACNPVTVTSLAPGIWKHSINVAGTGQQQYQQSLLVADPIIGNEVHWDLFSSVSVVDRADDPISGGDGCTGTDNDCSLRGAVTKANSAASAAQPVLIQFDWNKLPKPMTFSVTQNAPVIITAPKTMIDGVHPDGNPSPLDDFQKRQFPARQFRALINIDPVNKATSPAGTIRVQAEGVRLVGLSINRILDPNQANDPDGIDQCLLAFDPGSKAGLLLNCRLDGGAAARTNDVTGRDCVDAQNTGTSSFSDAVVVDNSELRYCHDRAVKSENGHVLVRDSWIHNNIRGGPFAQNPKGHLESDRNLIEQNGMNCRALPIPTSPVTSTIVSGTSFGQRLPSSPWKRRAQ